MKQLLKYFFLSFTFLLVTNNHVFAFGSPADTLRQKKVNGIKVKLYKVQKKDTWNSISRKNKVSVAYLTAVNTGIENLKAGQIINIPVEEGSMKRELPASNNERVMIPVTAKPVTSSAPLKESKYQVAVYHTVKKGETLYRISKFYNQPVENLRLWNEIKNNDVKVGQKIVVNYVYQYKKTTEPEAVAISSQRAPEIKETMPVKTEDKFLKEDSKNTLFESKPSEKLVASSEKNIPVTEEKSNNTSSVTRSPNGHMIRQVKETGVASWIMDGETNQNKYYALHRNAPVGTIVKVTNRMNGKYVFVKVVGLLPDTGDNDNLIIKISQAASNKINVLDSKFQAELSYGVAEY